MHRITEQNLLGLVGIINKMTGSPPEPWTTDADGKHHANVGNYHQEGAYGGKRLGRMCTDGGGVTDVFECGFTTKRDLYERMRAFMLGFRSCIQSIEEAQAKNEGATDDGTG